MNYTFQIHLKKNIIFFKMISIYLIKFLKKTQEVTEVVIKVKIKENYKILSKWGSKCLLMALLKVSGVPTFKLSNKSRCEINLLFKYL